MEKTPDNKSASSEIQLTENNDVVSKWWGRINFIRAVFALIFIAVVLKLAVIQAVNGFYYHQVALKQYESRVVLQANRGLICDRNGSLIVSNNYGYSYAADPELIDPSDKTKIAEKFAAVFNIPSSSFMDKLVAKSRFVWLARNIDPEQASALQNFSVYGLIRLQEQQRLYPYGISAGQVLGFTNVDGKGVSGVELQFDSVLAGKNGYEIMQRDGIGRKMLSVDYPKVDPVPGCNLQLTLDMNIEQIVEGELSAGIEAAKAKSGIAIFMNPNTGEILAIANYPSFDPSCYDKYSPEDSKDRAVTDAFEPGSTFKVVTASAALEEGIEKPNEMIFAENGRYTVRGRLIEDFEHAGWITFRQAVELSSNIAFSKVGMKIPPDKFYRYARDFGFGVPTGIELPGEVSGELKKPYEWSKVSLPFMSFGYEVMVTALQMTDAYAAIANGGTLLKPYIVSRITDSKGNILFQNSTSAIRRVVTPDIAQALSGLFVDVVEHGTGSKARVNDVLIAGKTGTAQKLIDGKYSKEFYRASFAGFFPVPNPQIVGFIMIDSPANGYTGGFVAAPIFKKIASRIYGIMQRRTANFVGTVNLSTESGSDNQNSGHMPSNSPGGVASGTVTGNMVRVPDVSFLDCNSAEAILQSHGLNVDYSNDHPATTSIQSDCVIQSEKPAAGTMVAKNTSIKLTHVSAKHITKMPDFRGVSVRQAASFFLSAGISFHILGSGKIVSQSPAIGQPISKNIPVIINCDSKSLPQFVRTSSGAESGLQW